MDQVGFLKTACAGILLVIVLFRQDEINIKHGFGQIYHLMVWTIRRFKTRFSF